MADSQQILKVNDFHQQLALYMIQNPAATLAQTATHFKYSAAYLSIVRNSDAFKAFYSKLFDRQFSQLEQINCKLMASTEQALDRLNNKLETIGDQLSASELKDIADDGLKRLGFGAMKTSAGPSIHVHSPGVVVVDRGDLESARQRMAEVHSVGSSVKQLQAPSGLPRSSSAPARSAARVDGVPDAEVVTK